MMSLFRNVASFYQDAIEKRHLIYELTKRDFQKDYKGSYLGIVWMFLQPLLFITVLYTIFTMGFKAGASVEDMPFALYLISGMICWLYFSSVFSSTTSVIKSHAFLVKKVDFRLSLLPIVKVLSVLIPHIFLLLITILLCWYQGYAPTFYTLQVIYYLISLMILLIGLGWITSSTSIFVKDISNIVAVIVQFGFWLTPIFWNVKVIPERYQWLVEFNPVFYIVNGYRDSLIKQVPVWDRIEETTIFWGITFLILIIGAVVYQKLRPHFAEVV